MMNPLGVIYRGEKNTGRRTEEWTGGPRALYWDPHNNRDRATVHHPGLCTPEELLAQRVRWTDLGLQFENVPNGCSLSPDVMGDNVCAAAVTLMMYVLCQILGSPDHVRSGGGGAPPPLGGIGGHGDPF